MRVSVLCVGAAIAATVSVSAAGPRLNPMVTLLEAKQAVFGLYAPSARAGSRASGAKTNSGKCHPKCRPILAIFG